ncbi:MAG: NAD(P)H-hydrate dehydratase [Lachnospiraceae bacterium]|nr:NAD(P)H-hydrate dehydratase [Lachnospiraceae bacterium]
MQYITSSDEAKKIDNISIREIGIPSPVLMEKAALSVYNHIINTFGTPDKAGKILAVCGVGNNGGDGVAVARLLKEAGYDSYVMLLGNIEKATDEIKIQINIAQNLDVKFVTDLFDNEYNIIIDAIFGIGLSRNVEGKYAECINKINNLSAEVVAVDIPSGINATTGEILGCAVKADYTVTFGTNKIGNVLYPGALNAGKTIVADIGFPKKAVQTVNPRAYTYSREDILNLLPARKSRTNKGSYGRVLVIAGSPGMSGACYFTAKAAYRMGCGLVKVMTSDDNLGIIKTKLPEAITSSYESDNISDAVNWADVIVIGPGIGINAYSEKLMKEVLNITDKPVIIDADGLNILSELNKKSKSSDKLYPYALSSNYIVTPHMKEMSRLIDVSVDDIKNNMMKYTSKQSKGCTIVLKDARTVISDGNSVYINTTGNNGLSTGGSGDVLAGMISGLVAQGAEPFEAAKLAVCIHGLAADVYTEKFSRYSMLASDILDILPEVMPY